MKEGKSQLVCVDRFLLYLVIMMFLAMLNGLDVSVGAVTKALQDAGMIHNSIIVFTTDNGGPAAGFNLNAASNWPLRGVSTPNILTVSDPLVVSVV